MAAAISFRAVWILAVRRPSVVWKLRCSGGGGAYAPDGSPVEVYRLMRPHREPELIHSVLPEGCEILELGCGAGRITHALLALGHPVTAVDQSFEMLSHV